MSKATSIITRKFKDTFVRVGSVEEAVEAQRLMFSMGFKRWSTNDRTPREVNVNFVYVDDDYDVLCNRTQDRDSKWREITMAELRDSAEAVRAIKRHESKKSKKRRAQRKWEATATKRTTENCPVRADVVVAVQFRNGDKVSGRAGEFCWGEFGAATIETYKVQKRNVHKPKPTVVSHEAMFTDIASSLGKGVAIVHHEEDEPDFVEVPEVDTPIAQVGDVNSNARGSGARFNAGKPDYSLIPMTLLEGEARVWAYGARKYKAWNWMKGMNWSVPFACAMRHMAAWQRGEDIDPETGESHLDHAMCNLRMLRYYTDFYKEGDDRPKEFFVKEAQ